jgi:predicted O-methyltransferase YrrM
MKKKLTFWDRLPMPLTYILSVLELRKLEKAHGRSNLCEIPSLYQGYGHFASISAKQVPDEIESLYTLVKGTSPQHILEIGTYKGGTFYLWCQAADEHSTLISIDLPGNNSLDSMYTPSRIKFYRKFSKSKNQKLHFITADSHQDKTVMDVKAILGKDQLDFIFIDGDHSYEGVKRDFDLYFHLVRPRGMVAFHDILPRKDFPGIAVYKLWNQLKTQYRYKEFIAQTGTYANFTGIGVIWKE